MGQEYIVRLEDPEETGDLGTATFPGMDWGTGSKPVLIWHEDPSNIVFKIPSGSHWTGLGMPAASHPGEYMVCEFVEGCEPGRPDAHGNRRARVRSRFSMPLSQRGRRS